MEILAPFWEGFPFLHAIDWDRAQIQDFLLDVAANPYHYRIKKRYWKGLYFAVRLITRANARPSYSWGRPPRTI